MRDALTNISISDRTDFDVLKEEANRMLSLSIAEIGDLRDCCDCFINRGQPKANLLVCAKPHLVLWVQFGVHPYWPAKLLKVNKKGHPLEVQFFGEFTSAAVAYTDCYLYTKTDPNDFVSDHTKEDFCKAIDVSRLWICRSKIHFKADLIRNKALIKNSKIIQFV